MGAETAAREVVPNQPTTPMRPNTCLPLSDTTPSSFPDTCSDSPSHPHLPIQRIPVRADLNLSHMTAQPKTDFSLAWQCQCYRLGGDGHPNVGGER
ncbi:unnamed protein product [Musa acuminata var. zebrina]